MRQARVGLKPAGFCIFKSPGYESGCKIGNLFYYRNTFTNQGRLTDFPRRGGQPSGLAVHFLSVCSINRMPLRGALRHLFPEYIHKRRESHGFSEASMKQRRFTSSLNAPEGLPVYSSRPFIEHCKVEGLPLVSCQ